MTKLLTQQGLVFALLLLTLTFAGCGGSPYEFAQVTGKVTLDGAPLENATVQFQPQRTGESVLVGPGSVGVTNSQGEFTLRSHKGDEGAVVAPHVVSISTFESKMVDPKNSDAVKVVSKERVPSRYRAPSELRVDVPDDGLSDAKFELTSK